MWSTACWNIHDFCKAFVEGNGEKKIYQVRAAEIDRLNNKSLEMDKAAKKDGEEYERRLAALQVELDKELEWKGKENEPTELKPRFVSLTKRDGNRIIGTEGRCYGG